MTWLPWWLGGPALALPIVAWWFAFRRPLGVSGSLARAVEVRRSREEDRVAEAMEDEAELERALREATLAEFGEGAVAATESAPSPSETEVSVPGPTHVRWTQSVGLVGGIVAGGLVAALATHRFHPTFELPPALLASVGSRTWGWLVIVAGGLCVGFGARLGGGCTSGHGLSGCARLALPSALATMVFLGCAVATAMLLGRG